MGESDDAQESGDAQELTTIEVSELISDLTDGEREDYVQNYVNVIVSDVTSNTQSVETSEASLQPSQVSADGPTASPTLSSQPTISSNPSTATGWLEDSDDKNGLAWYFYLGIAVIAIIWCVATVLLCKDFRGRGDDDYDSDDDDGGDYRDDGSEDRQHYDNDCYDEHS